MFIKATEKIHGLNPCKAKMGSFNKMDSWRRKWEMIEILERKMIELQEERCCLLRETLSPQQPLPSLAPACQKDQVVHEHKQMRILQEILKIYNSLNDLDADRNDEQKEEEEKEEEDKSLLSSFYSDLHDLRSNPQNIDSILPVVAPSVTSEEPDLQGCLFSGEESFGRFLDLSFVHQEYLNLTRNASEPSYIGFLKEFDTKYLERPIDDKVTIRSWRSYMKGLFGYLLGFIKKTHPLASLEIETASPNEDGIWCERCSHLFTNPSVYKNHLTGRKHLNGSSGDSSGDGSPTFSKDVDDQLSIMSPERMQFLIRKIMKTHLRIIKDATVKRCERRQVLTWEEREKELMAERKEFESYKEIQRQKLSSGSGAGSSTSQQMEGGTEEHEGKIYNPLNLPLDWDGKPIPYWLWKLHGLGTSFPCEICGNWAYKGRKAFDDHFVEGRHAQGMRSLGIPNTKHFHQVTSISEALWLWDGLKRSGRKAVFRPDVMEEFEDDEGNVYSRKTYEDLRRQGLI